jgi:hypothetical protein
MRNASRPFFRLLAAGLLALPSFLGAEHWAAYTDRRQNQLILQTMQEEDLGEALQAAGALGLRGDPYVADIRSGLLGSGQELPVLFLLRAVFPPAESPQVLAPRLSVNRSGLDELAGRLESFSPALRREAVRLLRLAGDRAYDQPVLAQAGWLRDRLRAQAGRADAELAELALEVLAYAGSSANPVFLDPVLQLRQSSRSAPVARRAAEVAEELARTASGNPAGW